MPGMNFSKIASNYFGAASWAGAAMGTRMGRTGSYGAMGALAGGVYGATMGRDPGQSRLGGFMTGAMGGAVLGAGGARYGGAAFRGGRSAYRAGNMGRFATSAGGAYGGMGLAGLTARGAGRQAFRAMRADAMFAARHIGPTVRTNAGNAWSSVKSRFR